MDAKQFFGAMFDPFMRITDFSGRSTRAQFWPFVFLQYVLQQIAGYIAMAPFLNKINALSEAQIANGGEPDPEAVAQLFNADVFTDLTQRFFWMSAIFGAIFLIPFAGALVRRLHDTNRSGFWALPSLLLLISGLFLMWRVMAPLFASGFQDVGPEFFGSFIPVFVNNLIYIGTVIMLIVFCVRDGTVGPNDYGDDPKDRSAETAWKPSPALTDGPKGPARVLSGDDVSTIAPPVEERPKGPARALSGDDMPRAVAPAQDKPKGPARIVWSDKDGDAG
jgi:uncharacterized membrane protein YhaH (DUF805 family)